MTHCFLPGSCPGLWCSPSWLCARALPPILHTWFCPQGPIDLCS